MLDRKEVLASMTEAQRNLILDQKAAESSATKAYDNFYKAKENDAYWETVGKLYGKAYKIECIEKAYWRLIEENFSPFQRRIIIELKDLHEKEFTSEPGTGMLTEQEVIDSLTKEEYQVIHNYEEASKRRDTAAEELNKAIDDKKSAVTIGNKQVQFTQLEDEEMKTLTKLCDTFGRLQRNIIQQINWEPCLK